MNAIIHFLHVIYEFYQFINFEYICMEKYIWLKIYLAWSAILVFNAKNKNYIIIKLFIIKLV